MRKRQNAPPTFFSCVLSPQDSPLSSWLLSFPHTVTWQMPTLFALVCQNPTPFHCPCLSLGYFLPVQLKACHYYSHICSLFDALATQGDSLSLLFETEPFNKLNTTEGLQLLSEKWVLFFFFYFLWLRCISESAIKSDNWTRWHTPVIPGVWGQRISTLRSPSQWVPVLKKKSCYAGNGTHKHAPAELSEICKFHFKWLF